MIKVTRYIIVILMSISCAKPPHLDFGERYLVKNYDVKKRKQIKKHFEKKKKIQLRQ